MVGVKNLEIGHCNIEGGLSTNLAKTTEIRNVIFKEQIDIFGINETNLNPEIKTDSLNIPLNYKLKRCDIPNSGSRGGYYGMLISKKLKYKVVTVNNTDMSKIEALWIELSDLNI